jgi:superfamily II DNA helicase RecQ
MLKLGKAAYCDIESCVTTNCIIGIYHSSSWQHCKERVISSLKGEGNIRIVIASIALSMGVNLPDIRYVINWGQARNILDEHQEAGRAGRDDFPCHNIIVYHGNQLSQCEGTS